MYLVLCQALWETCGIYEENTKIPLLRELPFYICGREGRGMRVLRRSINKINKPISSLTISTLEKRQERRPAVWGEGPLHFEEGRWGSHSSKDLEKEADEP